MCVGDSGAYGPATNALCKRHHACAGSSIIMLAQASVASGKRTARHMRMQVDRAVVVGPAGNASGDFNLARHALTLHRTRSAWKKVITQSRHGIQSNTANLGAPAVPTADFVTAET